MGAVFFYHLTERPLEAVLPDLLMRSRERGWKVIVRGRDSGRLDWLDQKLWTGPDEAFLAHGMTGGVHDALQPILLTTGMENPNGASCLMAVDGAEISPAEVGVMERACILFDGIDSQALDIARRQWKSLTGAGCSAQYWAQEGKSWTKKAEAGGV